MNLQQLKAQHRAKAREARALYHKITDDTPEAEARKIERDFNAIMLDVDELRDRIEDVEDRAAGDRPDPRRPNEDAEGRGVDLGGNSEHRAAFCNWLRAPKSDRTRQELMEAERRTASSLTDAAGGYLVPEVIMQPIFARARDVNPFRSVVRVVDVQSGDVRFPLSESDADSGWVGETDTRTATDEPTLVSKTPTFGVCYSYVKMTEELAQDALIDVGAWFQTEAGRALGEAEMNAIISGNGTDKPSGFLNVAPESGDDGSRTADALKYIPTGDASALGSDAGDKLLDLYYDLKSQYRANATWLMNSSTAAAVRKLKNGSGDYLWADSLQSGQPPRLLGHPVAIAEGMPDIGADEHPIAFGDWNQGYILAKRGDLFVTVDNNITTPGLIKLYIRHRIGGCVYDENAVRVLKCAVS
ncbi:phage major capsid protein [Roseovarius amoyensis]|uniref:phage major capsid protein n=1 Tax=Roseovarius amoyensis TaxID=2211448 RepID=UPI000DBE37BF|nr:phage major capsid protein [Roseovarius amoyensis]